MWPTSGNSTTPRVAESLGRVRGRARAAYGRPSRRSARARAASISPSLSPRGPRHRRSPGTGARSRRGRSRARASRYSARIAGSRSSELGGERRVLRPELRRPTPRGPCSRSARRRRFMRGARFESVASAPISASGPHVVGSLERVLERDARPERVADEHRALDPEALRAALRGRRPSARARAPRARSRAYAPALRRSGDDELVPGPEAVAARDSRALPRGRDRGAARPAMPSPYDLDVDLEQSRRRRAVQPFAPPFA